jgi:6-phosphogluconolactonase
MIRKLVGALILTLPAVCVPQLSGQGVEHLYVTNQAGSSISLYDMDPSTGKLASITTFATPRVPISLSFNSTGTYAYLTSGGPNPAITSYAVNAGSGSFTEVASLSLNPRSIPVAKVDPLGKFLFVVDIRSGAVTTYHLKPDGSISAAGNTRASNLIGQLVFLRGAGIAYAGGPTNVLTRFSFSPSSGAVSQSGSTGLAAAPPSAHGIKAPVGKYVVLQPSGKYLYVVDLAAATITGFAVNPSGALTQLPGKPYSLSAFVPLGFSFAASGDFLYFGNWSVGSIMGLKVNSDGSLTPLQSAATVTPFQTSTRHGGYVRLTADPSGKFLYAFSAETNQITGYSVNQNTGALVAIPGSLLSTGNLPAQAVFAP